VKAYNVIENGKVVMSFNSLVFARRFIAGSDLAIQYSPDKLESINELNHSIENDASLIEDAQQ
jgi:hypothetical protein